MFIRSHWRYISLLIVFQISKGNFRYLGDYNEKARLLSVCVNETISQGRSYSFGDIEISFCSFFRTSSFSESGGVIYIITGSLGISNSMFFNCSSSLNGGAIYFDSSTIQINRICGNCCKAVSGQFLFLRTQNNNIGMISVSYCCNNGIGSYSINIFNGNNRLDDSNSSFNYCNQVSGFGVSSPSSFSSSMCTIAHTSVKDSLVLLFVYFNSTISYTNIVSNHSPTHGVIYLDRNPSVKMMYCIFSKNSNHLFSVRQGNLCVYHSFIEHNSNSLSTSASVSTNNVTLTITQTHFLTFFSSYFCPTDYTKLDIITKSIYYQNKMRLISFLTFALN